MKHLKTFESYNVVNEEGVFRKFFTGHSTIEEKEEAKKNFIDALSSAESELEKNPEDYAQSENWESTKRKLMDQAEDNKYNGGLRVQRGGRDGRFFIIYDEGVSGLQKLASASATEVNVRR